MKVSSIMILSPSSRCTPASSSLRTCGQAPVYQPRYTVTFQRKYRTAGRDTLRTSFPHVDISMSSIRGSRKSLCVLTKLEALHPTLAHNSHNTFYTSTSTVSIRSDRLEHQKGALSGLRKTQPIFLPSPSFADQFKFTRAEPLARDLQWLISGWCERASERWYDVRLPRRSAYFWWHAHYGNSTVEKKSMDCP